MHDSNLINTFEKIVDQHKPHAVPKGAFAPKKEMYISLFVKYT
jgi:hypothetical protein